MCERNRSTISILIPVALLFGVAVIVGCYIITWDEGDLAGASFSFISDLGNRNPQQILFALGFGVLAAFFCAVTVLRFIQLRWAIVISQPPANCCCDGLNGVNVAMLVIILVALVNMVLLAAFNNLDFHLEHNIFAVLCFGGMFVYEVMHTVLQFVLHYSDFYVDVRYRNDRGREPAMKVNNSPFEGFYEPSHIGVLVVYLLCNAVSFTALVIASFHYFDVTVGQSAIAETVLVASIMAYFVPWFWEMQNVTCARVSAIGEKAYKQVVSFAETKTSDEEEIEEERNMAL